LSEEEWLKQEEMIIQTNEKAIAGMIQQVM
jgi:hypothetical protein